MVWKRTKEEALHHLNECGIEDVDHALLDKLVANMKLIVDNKDAIRVSGTDPAELETARKIFFVKKLDVHDKDLAMAAINSVALDMSSIRLKNRAAFYYMVQTKIAE